MNRVERFTKVSPNFSNIDVLKGKLYSELASLEHRLSRLKGGYSATDLSLSQTYKEMIYGRRELLNRISVN